MEKIKFNTEFSFEVTLSGMIEVKVNGDVEYLDVEDVKLLVKFLNKYIEKNDN